MWGGQADSSVMNTLEPNAIVTRVGLGVTALLRCLPAASRNLDTIWLFYASMLWLWYG